MFSSSMEVYNSQLSELQQTSATCREAVNQYSLTVSVKINKPNSFKLNN